MEMKIDKKINQKNAAGQLHGYFEDYYDIDKKQLYYKCHWFNDEIIGYYECLRSHGSLWYKCHFINLEIGCELKNNSQYFYNKPRIKFGEEIEWKLNKT